MTRHLAFAETVAQWQALSALEGLQVIPVNPAVDDQATRNGEPYRTVEDFCDHDTLMQLGDENIVRCEQLMDDLDALLRTVTTDHQGVVSTDAFFHPLKGLLDSLTRRSLPVVHAIDELAPDAVVCFQCAPYEVSGRNLLDKPAVSMTSHIVALMAAARGIHLLWLPEPVAATPQVAANPNDEPVVEVPAQAPRHDAGAGWPRDGQALLVHSLFADLGTRIVELWAHGMGTHQCFGAVFPESEVAAGRTACQQLGTLLWQRARQHPTIRRHFVVHGVDLFPLAESTLRRICEEGVPDLLAFAPVAERHLQRLGRAVIATGGMMERNMVLGRLAHATGIPVVSIHYGGFLGYSLLPMHERYDLADADYFATGGEGAAGTFAQPSTHAAWRPERKRARPVPLGAPWIDEIASKERARDSGGNDSGANHGHSRRIMYVMSALLGDNAYLGYTFHPEIWYHRFQRRLVQTLAGHPDCRVLLKPPLKGRYPQIDNPIFDWLLEQDYDNVELMGDVPLADVLGEADAFIIDSPSTPLLQLAATDKPFLAYADRDYFKFQEDAAALLAKRAMFSDTEEGFFRSLDRFMSEADWSRGPVNDEFLAAYATGGTDGRAAERVTGFLHRVALGMTTPTTNQGATHVALQP